MGSDQHSSECHANFLGVRAKKWLRARLGDGAVAQLTLAPRTGTRDRDVVAIKGEAVILLQVLAERIKVRGGNFDGGTAVFADQVPVNRAGEVVHGGGLAEVRVHHNVQFLELLENPVDGRGAHIGSEHLDEAGDLVGSQVAMGLDEHPRHGALGDRDSLGCRPYGREDLVKGR